MSAIGNMIDDQYVEIAALKQELDAARAKLAEVKAQLAKREMSPTMSREQAWGLVTRECKRAAGDNGRVILEVSPRMLGCRVDVNGSAAWQGNLREAFDDAKAVTGP